MNTTAPPAPKRRRVITDPAPRPPIETPPLTPHSRDRSAGIDIGVACWIAVVHLGALAAPWTFSWIGLATMLGLYFLTGCVGICLGYHRLLGHRSFETYRPVRWLIAWIGGLAGEGSAIHWVANHRIHHAKSDHDGDPHSPREGFWWSHMMWCMQRIPAAERIKMHTRWAPDLAKDPVMRFLDRSFLTWQVVLGVSLAATGWAWGGFPLAASMVVWGMFVRMVIVLHATWCINSVTHVWGYKTYDNGDDSRNLWWVALVTFGEGWHNNHHAYQKAANYGHRWWELDTTYLVIRLMAMLGLAWNVAPIPARAKEILARRRLPPQ